MYSVTDEYLEQVHKAVQTWRLTGTVGDVEIADDNILQGSLSVTNKCTESDVGLGSVCIGEMKVTFLHNTGINRFSYKGAVIKLSIGLLVNGEYEDVPLPPYTISKAKYTASGIVVTAYDYMEKFDRTLPISQISGTPYELLSVACYYCGVTLGMTEEEINALPNGNLTVSMADNTYISTYRDFIAELATAMCGYCMINRDGALIIKTWQSEAVDEYTDASRFSGAEYDNYITLYDGVYLTYSGVAEYYGTGKGSTISLGSNPLLQISDDEVRKTMTLTIVENIGNIQYMPCKFSVACGIHLDLGDVLTISSGLIDDPVNVCVMEYTYVYKKSFTINCYGEDPASSASSKQDKEIAGLTSTISSNQYYLKTFTNAKALTVGDGKSVRIISMAVASSISTALTFMCEILAQVEMTEDVESATVTVTYYVQGAKDETYQPKQIYVTSGDHMIHLLYFIPVEKDSTGNFLVYLTAAGCSLSIPASSIQAGISGSGIVQESEWDGTIDIVEEFTPITISELVTVPIDSFTEAVEIIYPDSNDSTASDVFSGVTIGQLVTIGTFTETVVGDMPVTNYTFSQEYESEYTYDTAIVIVENDMFELVDTFVLSGVAEEVDEGLMSVMTIDKSNYTSVGGIEVK